jgi:hypothetical protein
MIVLARRGAVKQIADATRPRIARSAAALALKKTRNRPKFLCNRRPVMGRITRRGATESLARRQNK